MATRSDPSRVRSSVLAAVAATLVLALAGLAAATQLPRSDPLIDGFQVGIPDVSGLARSTARRMGIDAAHHLELPARRLPSDSVFTIGGRAPSAAAGKPAMLTGSWNGGPFDLIATRLVSERGDYAFRVHLRRRGTMRLELRFGDGSTVTETLVVRRRSPRAGAASR